MTAGPAAAAAADPEVIAEVTAVADDGTIEELVG